MDNINFDSFSPKVDGRELTNYLISYKRHYQKQFNESTQTIEKKMAFIEKSGRNVAEEKNEFRNESLADLVTNVTARPGFSSIRAS